ncbi:DNRLRE domain-containing protein [Pseudorhodoferax sp.]|uniref:DNRLRE domain-containing protein n=1 Tax=Pseudorhodoferax sp. TaxID=1993553 RepID=UPI002DD698FD|nr:DNRLRE domain-containing protein [Pseudorhodoferax sp.]
MSHTLSHRRLPQLLAAVAVAALTACSGDGEPQQGTQGLTGPALASRQMTLEPLAVPLVTEGEAYAGTLRTPDGSAARRWQVLGGRLPGGLDLDESTGAVTGTTTEIGRHDLEIGITGVDGQVTRWPLRIDVIEADDPGASARSLSRRPQGGAGTPASGSLDDLLSLIESTGEGEWVQASLNTFESVWTPAALRPRDSNNGTPAPSKIIGAWSGFAWDGNRGDLVLYGGGHANYPGNDIYRWRGSTRQWERASLPSEVTKDARNNFVAVDGAANAPSSSHTYDNNIFLPIADRLLVLGGAAYNNGGAFMADAGDGSSRKTGPYLWDPNRADANKVGGTTGSHVTRVAPYAEITGGQMWQNREMWLNLASSGALPNRHVDGCTAYAEESGKDVVYFAAMSAGGTAKNLYRYVINDVARPDLDSLSRVGGFWDAPQGQTACGYDAARKHFVRLGSSARPFMLWDLSTPGNTNYEKTVGYTEAGAELAGRLSSGSIDIKKCGFDYAPGLDRHALWCGGGEVWMLAPASGNGATGWTLAKQAAPVGAAPVAGAGVGILGKWKFIPELGVFLALQDNTAGNIWIYKPVGWTNPGGSSNIRPEVSLTAPVSGQSFVAGDPIVLQAAASDADGSVARVDFYAGTTLIGSATAAPWQAIWTTAPIGSHTLTALAVDDLGAQRVSAAVSITVAAGNSGTILLQAGLDGYAGSKDAYLSSFAKTTNYGGSSVLYEQGTSYTNLLRFAVFQREGGPVPDGAVITEASLSVYKVTSYSVTLALHRLLQDWDERQATWNLARTGVAWATAGAGAAGTDYAAAIDAQSVAAAGAGWATFDVTAALADMQAGASNHGWRLRRTAGDNANLKRFHSGDQDTDANLRPRLQVSYYIP